MIFHRRIHISTILVLLATSCAASAAFAQNKLNPDSEVEGFSMQRLKAIGEQVRADVKAERIPGGVLMVMRNGRLVYADAIGTQNPRLDSASKTAMGQDAIFRIYSMTKPIVAVAVMMMVEEGRILITDPVTKYFPEFKDLKVGVEKADASGNKILELVPLQRPITIHDLLRHTAGFTYGFQGKSLVKDEYNKLRIDSGNHTSLEFIEKLAKVPLQFQPGTNWDYSVATDVLGVLLERLSGQTLEECLLARIFRPLGMNDTGFWVPADKQNRIAEPFEIDPDFKIKTMLSNPRKPPKMFSGGGGLVSTAPDYVRFMQMLINGGQLDGATGQVRILSRKTVEYMLADHLGNIRQSLPREAVESFGPRPGYGFGLGFAVRLPFAEGGVTGQFGTAGSGDWNGLSGPNFWIDPTEKLAVVWMMQAPGARAYYRQMIPNRVYGAMVK